MAPVSSVVVARLDASIASRFAAIALANVVREFPNHPGHVLDDPADALTPRTLHPAFYGSYDWHSCVHMHWLLARVRRLFPALPQADAVGRIFDAHLTPQAIAAEVAYFHRPGTQSFERTYGWAWLLALAVELHACDDAPARRWRDALGPLAAMLVQRYLGFLPRARYPIRYGVHPNSAFGLAWALDYARACGERALEDAVCDKARAWYDGDRDLPAAWEPSGADFFSPALVEADLMRRVLAPARFAEWLACGLPGLRSGVPATLFEPVPVSDRTDPQIVHLDGLNLSRAWCFRGMAGALGGDEALCTRLHAAAERHLAAGMIGLSSGDYFGEHWLATFATLALTA
jgi:hypothetical protein